MVEYILWCLISQPEFWIMLNENIRTVYNNLSKVKSNFHCNEPLVNYKRHTTAQPSGSIVAAATSQEFRGAVVLQRCVQ